MGSEPGDVTCVLRFVRRGRMAGVQGSNLRAERPGKKERTQEDLGRPIRKLVGFLWVFCITCLSVVNCWGVGTNSSNRWVLRYLKRAVSWALCFCVVPQPAEGCCRDRAARCQDGPTSLPGTSLAAAEAAGSLIWESHCEPSIVTALKITSQRNRDVPFLAIIRITILLVKAVCYTWCASLMP